MLGTLIAFFTIVSFASSSPANQAPTFFDKLANFRSQFEHRLSSDFIGRIEADSQFSADERASARRWAARAVDVNTRRA